MGSPYGKPTIHAPALPGAWQGPAKLAIRNYSGGFQAAGHRSTENLLDANDVGRPTNGTQWTWVRNGAPPAAQSLIGWAHLFTGRPWDAETRQYYYRYRWYDPHACRWLSLDPIGYAGGLVQYAYCGGNPVNFVDPWGFAPIECEAAWEGVHATRGLVRDNTTDSAWGNFLLGATAGLTEFWLTGEGPIRAWEDENASMLDVYFEAQEDAREVFLFFLPALKGGGSLARSTQAIGRQALFDVMDLMRDWGRGLGRPVGGNLAPSLGRRGAASFGPPSGGRAAPPKAFPRPPGCLADNPTPPAGMTNPQRHHWFVQMLRREFKEIGIDIDDPRFMSWVEGGPKGPHQKQSRAYGQLWTDFFEKTGRDANSAFAHLKKIIEEDKWFK